jgi:uncharacterized membrane protein YgdD (TMEM256/DUF423 family)
MRQIMKNAFRRAGLRDEIRNVHTLLHYQLLKEQKAMVLSYKMSTMKSSDFGDVLKIGECLFCQVLRVSRLLQESKFPPKCLGYLTGHHWAAPTVY